MKKDIIFVTPYTRSTSSRPPLNLACLAAYLDTKGLSNEIVDIKGKDSSENLIKRIIGEIKQYEPFCIGITCLSTEVLAVKKLSSILKQNFPKSFIIVGGPEPTINPKHFENNDGNIDFLIMGEGEYPLVDLINCLKLGKDYKQLESIGFFEDGLVQLTRRSSKIINLQELPSPAYHKLNMKYYLQPTLWGIRGIPLSSFFIMAARGCPFNCKFCATNIIFGKGVRYLDGTHLGRETKKLLDKYKVDGLFYYDEVFTINKKRVSDFCNYILENKLKFLWGCQTRVNLIDKEMLKLMKKAGCIQISFGVESGSEKLLQSIRKGITVKQIKKAISLCKEENISQFINLMVNLPGETKEDLQKTINLARELNPNIIVWNVTTPWPGSELNKQMSIEEFDSLNNLEDDKFYDLINQKYHLAEHNINIKMLMHKLFKEFPNRRKINYLPNLAYIKKVLNALFFIYDKRYIKQILRSKRKVAYLKWIYNSLKGNMN